MPSTAAQTSPPLFVQLMTQLQKKYPAQPADCAGYDRCLIFVSGNQPVHVPARAPETPVPPAAAEFDPASMPCDQPPAVSGFFVRLFTADDYRSTDEPQAGSHFRYTLHIRPAK